MAAPTSTLDGFIRTLHRRLVMVRAAEAAGLGALAGCAIALLLIPVLIWRNQPPLLPAAIVVGLGALGGLLWNLSRRPTRLEAAMEADRQLELADLLGTAVGVREGGSDDPWRQTVFALADATARRHAPSQVLLNRLGARAWGGIGLAAALVFTLAALPSFPTGADASSGSDRVGRRPNRIKTTDIPGPFAATQTPHRNRASPASPREAGNDTESIISPESSDAGENEANRKGTADDGGRENAGDRDGVGGGTAKARQPGRGNPSLAPPQAVRANPPTSPDGTTGGAGGATGSESGKTNPTDSGTAANGSGAAKQTPPWKSDNWPQDVRRANQVIESGALPDAYRDLVRGYFDRP